MSHSRELQLHIAQIEEIRSILNSMKNLALIEIHKLTRFQNMQGQAVANIENVALDFLNFYPLTSTEYKVKSICILVGAERGFCGDFNESLINSLVSNSYSGIIAIGNRLSNKLTDKPFEIMASIAGANVSEEVPTILNHLIDTINSLSTQKTDINGSTITTHSLQLTVIYHDLSFGKINHRQLFPPFLRQQQKSVYGNPPILNIEPSIFFSELVDPSVTPAAIGDNYAYQGQSSYENELFTNGAVTP